MKHSLLKSRLGQALAALGAVCGMLFVWGNLSAQEAAPPAAADVSQIQLGPSCVTADCHGEVSDTKFLHGPVNLGQCQPCHIPVNNQHVFQDVPEGPALCYTCHEQLSSKEHVHAPFAADCTGCHDPHGDDNRYFIKGGTGSESCLRCHGTVTEGMQHLHGPVAMGECLVCHTAHQSDYDHLLVDEPNVLCQNCHTDVQESLEGAVSIHEPAQNNCTGCHQAHGGNEEFFLVRSGSDLCQSCHGEFLDQVSKFKHPHQPMTEGKACQECHKPHASNQAQLLHENNMQLCLSCHNKAMEGEPHDVPSIAAQVENAKFLHGPLREDNCIACHAAHGSDHENILDKAFPDDFYTAFEADKYDLCFNCHDRQIVMEAESTVTGFRNGETNLHHLHVNREKGRSCRACHHEHASSQPNHVRTSVPFGRWEMPVEFNKTETGGGCTTGCHIPYNYDRENAVKNTAAVTP